MQITTLDNGSLKITVTPEEAAKIIANRADKVDFDVLNDLLEPYWTNGQYHVIDGNLGPPWCGLTSAICIAEELEYNNDVPEIVGKMWYYNDTATKDLINELTAHLELVFALSYDTKNEAKPAKQKTRGI